MSYERERINLVRNITEDALKNLIAKTKGIRQLDGLFEELIKALYQERWVADDTTQIEEKLTAIQATLHGAKDVRRQKVFCENAEPAEPTKVSNKVSIRINKGLV